MRGAGEGQVTDNSGFVAWMTGKMVLLLTKVQNKRTGRECCFSVWIYFYFYSFFWRRMERTGLVSTEKDVEFSLLNA